MAGSRAETHPQPGLGWAELGWDGWGAGVGLEINGLRGSSNDKQFLFIYFLRV